MKNLKTYEQSFQQIYQTYYKKYNSFDYILDDLNVLESSNIEYNIYTNLDYEILIYAFVDTYKNKNSTKQCSMLSDIEYVYSNYVNNMHVGLNIKEIEKELFNKYENYDCILSTDTQKLEEFKMSLRASKFNI